MDSFAYNRHLRRIKSYVESRISGPIRLDDVAQVAGVSKVHFSRMFHQQTGMRFQDWLALLRVERAKRLLSLSDSDITHVGFSAGFGSVSSFGRAFKKWEGVTPRQYRKQIQRSLAVSGKQTPKTR